MSLSSFNTQFTLVDRDTGPVGRHNRWRHLKLYKRYFKYNFFKNHLCHTIWVYHTQLFSLLRIIVNMLTQINFFFMS